MHGWYGRAVTASPTPSAPTRGEIEEHWLALIEGQTTREAVHEWSVQWVENEDVHVPDPSVRDALLRLHGFDMTYRPERPGLVTHGPPGLYVHSQQHIVDELSRWRASCVEYDADPVGFRRRALERAAAYLSDSKDPSERQTRNRILALLAGSRGVPRPRRRDG
jgi:hypothetical protein